jgi:hypothetical protein
MRLGKLAIGWRSAGATGCRGRQSKSDRMNRPLSLARRHPRRKAARLGQGTERQGAGRAQGRSGLQKDYDSVLACSTRPTAFPTASSTMATFSISGRTRTSQGHLAAHDDCRLRQPVAAWETLLDIDKLSADEHENWVWKGADCAPGAHALPREPLARRRRCGGGARVRSRDEELREGRLHAARSEIDRAYRRRQHGPVRHGFRQRFDDDVRLSRIVKLWKRGEPTIAARRRYWTGKLSEDVSSVSPVSFVGRQHSAHPARVSFFETEYYLPAPMAHGRNLPVPLSADLEGHDAGPARLHPAFEDWAPPGGAKLIAQRFADRIRARRIMKAAKRTADHCAVFAGSALDGR